MKFDSAAKTFVKFQLLLLIKTIGGKYQSYSGVKYPQLNKYRNTFIYCDRSVKSLLNPISVDPPFKRFVFDLSDRERGDSDYVLPGSVSGWSLALAPHPGQGRLQEYQEVLHRLHALSRQVSRGISPKLHQDDVMIWTDNLIVCSKAYSTTADGIWLISTNKFHS